MINTYTCQRCSEKKGADDMVIRGGKPSKTCKACFSASFAKKSGGKVKRSGEKRERSGEKRERSGEKREQAPPPVKLNGLSLEIARGYGFRASADTEQLVIEQDADDGATATVVFSKTEAKVLFALIGEWAGLLSRL